MLPLAWVPGVLEWVIIGGFGLLLFGKRLPEVGKGVAQAIVQFKRGLKEAESEVTTIDHQIDAAASRKTIEAQPTYQAPVASSEPVGSAKV